MNGLPENINVTSAEIREALAEPLSHVVEAIKVTLEKTPQLLRICRGASLRPLLFKV